jgi:response regulator RpfG family c-di-GMP phosphodiesterase
MKAVILYKDTTNPLGLPGEYPAETRDIQQGETVTAPWVEMSESEIEGRISQYSETVKQITTAAESVPQDVALWQFRAAVALAGLKDAVDAAVAALPEPSKTVATEKWEYGNTVRRNHAMITTLSAALGLTSTQVDNIFKTAASLQ